MGSGQVLKRSLEATDPDVRLMLQVRDDVPGAFEELIERYQNRLLGVLVHLVGRIEEAEDLTQDVFLRVYRSRKRYQPRAKFSTWLFTIAHNRAMNTLRRKGRRPRDIRGGDPSDSRVSLWLEQNALAPGGTPSTQVRKVELAEIVREALEGLGEDQKMAVLLNKFEEMSYEEIAGVMGRSESAIKSLLMRARVKLRERLEPYFRSGQRGL